jgi:trehalose 6-phosphate synthase/phosphatase
MALGRSRGGVTRERLLVVSNRLPLTARRVSGRWRSERSAGGLVAAMAPLMRRLDGLWLGWPGEITGDARRGRDALIRRWEEEHRYVAVDLPARVSRAFYEGYANDTLWPLLHGFVSRVVLQPEAWHAYVDASERFAAAVLERHRRGDLVWVHDYQLLLVPELIRREARDARIGFFLHIPFPASEAFRILPQRDRVLRGMLGADEIAFQTHGHLHEFRRALLQVLGLESRMDRVEVDGRTVRLEALPIGIASDEWERLAGDDASVARRVDELRGRHAGRRLLVAVDRLDYTKGLPERLRTFRRLLRGSPDLRGRVTLIQVAVPSRERVPAYADLRREVSELVGEVNGEFGTPEWQPVVYLHRAVPRPELAALYAAADVGWVGPLRDGMNLVAKEYVACQKGRAGVLVLSEFAGAAQELGEALRINPYDEEGTAEVILRALELPAVEREERMRALLERVRRNDAATWGARFLDGLRAATGGTGRAPPRPSRHIDPGAAGAALAAASRRLLLIDYDGTLVPIAPRPRDATPSRQVRALLASLAALPATTLMVISGRQRSEIEPWLGDLEGLWLAVEHGALIREPGRAWTPLRPGADVGWKSRVRPVLEHFAASAPGSFVEEKEYALGWHYRLADPEFGAWLASEMVNTLDHLLAGTELAVLHGSKVVEVRFAWANKGEVASFLRGRSRRAGFVLAIGDDRTDEDLFERLPRHAWTVRVGSGPTRARFRLGGPAEVVGLLELLVASAGPSASPGDAGEPPTGPSEAVPARRG